MPRPSALVVAGPNGSGKSTLIRQLQNEIGFPFPENYINADDIERELDAETTVAKADRERVAFRIARQRRRLFREEGVSHAFETVFSHTSNLLDLQRLRDTGFMLTLCMVATQDPALNVERVKRRVAAGGHDVAVDKVLARYARSLKFLPRAAEIADLTYVYDNSDALTLIGYFTAGVWRPVLPSVPAYIDETFVQQIKERRTERQAMAPLGGEDGLNLPDEENGQYTGTAVAAGVHYLVQAVVEDALTTLYRHDALWLTEPPQQDWINKTVLIHYGQAEYGLATVSFTETGPVPVEISTH